MMQMSYFFNRENEFLDDEQEAELVRREQELSIMNVKNWLEKTDHNSYSPPCDGADTPPLPISRDFQLFALCSQGTSGGEVENLVSGVNHPPPFLPNDVYTAGTNLRKTCLRFYSNLKKY